MVALYLDFMVVASLKMCVINYCISYTMTNTSSKNNLRNVQLQYCCLRQLKGFHFMRGS